MTPLLGFTPDIDPTTKGAIVECTNLIPTLKGMSAGKTGVSAGVAALGAECKGAALCRKLDNTARLFAGTTTALYEAGATTWTDVSRAVGGAYNGSTETVWRFAQYGNVSLAAQIGDTIQSSNGTGAFANIAGAPKAAVIETVGDFVMALNYNDGTSTPDGWYCCALGDYSDWTPAIATQCANGRLTSTPGEIRGGKRLGDLMVAYKERGIYIGIYAGPPVIWEWREVSSVVGAPSHEVIVPIVTEKGGQAHIFMGYDDFYYFDGSAPVAIGSYVKEWFFARVGRKYMKMCKALHDPFNKRIYWYYPTNNGSTLTACIVYNYVSGKWGTDDREVEACVDFVAAGETYASFDSDYSTYNGVPSSISYGLASFNEAIAIPTYFDSSHTMYWLNGTSNTSSFTLGDIGDDQTYSCITRVVPRYLTSPATASLTNYYRNVLGDTLTLGVTTSLSSGRFDVLRSARWHRVKHDTTGNMEITAIGVNAEPGGDE